MLGKYNGFVNKDRVFACMYFLQSWKKITRLLKFSNFVPLPPYTMLVFTVGDICCKSTLPEPPFLEGGRRAAFKVNSSFN
jgi:hypothetical protein